ncbi:WD40 repeat-like protein [Aspergillus fijiensis CBS 313.89]|uniref:WD40 repeat-like protein n=1 Tax=Aspergillus fijiensis CBS 313.89 TaxID=1448319 RepID=A0A8G1S0N7_9EURO|nr:WD40 repeat-like protein [Aspergillus fijiensis CBS 313.89]RAK81250.1 WD40 repeat-like protein [Aspergillus fijiensis CBS 313.89]
MMTNTTYQTGKNDGTFVGVNSGTITISSGQPVSFDQGLLRDLRRALFVTDPEEDRAALKLRKGDRAQGTCDWMLETDEIREWLDEENDGGSNIMWLYGNPGTGKSTMAITLTDEIAKQEPFLDGSKTLTYFFCDSADERRRTVTALLRGLLYQFQRQHSHFLNHFQDRFLERGKDLFDSFEALWSIFIRIINDESIGHKYCVIDALDECENSSQLLTQLDQYYRNLPKQHENRLHILITSRPYPEICEYLQSFRHKDLGQYHQRKQDIKQMITEKVQDLKRRKNYTARIEREVTQILLDKAEGTFLWIGIACQELSSVRVRDAVQTLQRLPRGLDSLYRELLDNAIQQGEIEKTKIIEILQFVAVAKITMTVSQLSRACRSYEDDDDEERIAFFKDDIRMCRLMVIIEGNFVRLLHKSVEDFLLGVDNDDVTQRLKAHAALSYRCISYIVNWDLNNRSTDQDFLQYSTHFWTTHAHLAKKEFSILEQHRAFYDFAASHWIKWWSIFTEGTSTICTSSFTLFHAAANWDIEALAELGLEMLVDNKMGPRSVKYDDREFKYLSHKGTPLRIAASQGHTNIIQMLLNSADMTLEINAEIIHAATKNTTRGSEILQLFLDFTKGNLLMTESILELAARNTGCGFEILQIIFSHYGDSIRPQISENVMKHAMANQENGSKLVGLIAGRFPGIMNTLATHEAFKFAISNDRDNIKLVDLLFTHASEVIISEQIVETAIPSRKNTREITLQLFSRADRASVLTERIILNAASHSTQLCQDLIRMTLETAAQSRFSAGLKHLIVSWCDVTSMNLFLHVMDSQSFINQNMIAGVKDEDAREILRTRMKLQCLPTAASTPTAESHIDSHSHRLSIRQINVIEDHTDEVWTSAFSPNGDRLASGGRDNIIRVYDCMKFVSVAQLIGHKEPVTCLAWSPKGAELISGSFNGSIRIWNAETYACLIVLNNHKSIISAISWVPDGQTFISSSYSECFCHWTKAGELLHTVKTRFSARYACIAPDGTQLIMASSHHQLEFYCLKTYSRIISHPLEANASSIAVEHDTGLALLDLGSGEMQVIDLSNGVIAQRYQCARSKGIFLTRGTFFAPHNSLILGCRENSKICVWDRHTGLLVDVLDHHKHGCVNSVSVNPANPNMFISTGDDHTVRVWEMGPRAI